MRQGIKFLSFIILTANVCAEQNVNPVIKRVDLPEAVRLAYLNHPALLTSLEDIAIADQRLRMAIHLLYPQFGFDATAATSQADRSLVITEGFGGAIVTPPEPRHFYLGRGFVEQALYTGGRNSNAIILARANSEKAKSLKEQTRLQVLKEVRLNFLEFLKVKETIDTKLELQALLTKYSRVSGTFEKLVWEDKKTVLEENASDLQSTSSHESKVALLKAMGMDLSSEVEIVGALEELPLPKTLPSLQQALSWAREFRPEYKAKALESEMDATQVAIALAGRNPVVSLAGLYEFLGNDFPLRQNNWTTMLRVHLPFSWDNWATVRERKAQQRRGQIKHIEVEDQVGLEVRQAYTGLARSLERLAKAKKRLRSWRDFSQTDQLKDERQRLQFFEIYEQTTADWTRVLVDTLKLRYELEYAMGRDLQ